eukprot:scaffold15353_cov67-Isochrysis_galbana.AAC.2
MDFRRPAGVAGEARAAWRESAALSIGSSGRVELPSEADRACKHWKACKGRMGHGVVRGWGGVLRPRGDRVSSITGTGRRVGAGRKKGMGHAMGGAALGIEVGVRRGRRRRRCMGEGGWVDGCIGRDGVDMSLRPVNCWRGAFFSHRWLELGRLTVGNQQQHRVGGTAGALPEGESGEEQPEQLDGAPPGSVGRVGVLGQPEKLRDHQRRVVLEWGSVATPSDGKEEGGKGGKREKRRRRGRARGAGRVGRGPGVSPGGR